MFIANAPTAAPPEVPFQYDPPTVRRETPDDALLNAEPAIATAMTFARGADDRARTEADLVSANRAWSHTGRRNQFTHRAALPVLKDAERHRAALDARARALGAERDAILQAADLAKASEEQRHQWRRLGDAFGRLPDAARSTELARAMVGEDAELRDALAYDHPIVTRVDREQVARLQRLAFAARVDRAALDTVEGKLAALGAVRRELEATLVAVTSAADSDTLREAGVPMAKTRREMSDAEKIEAIQRHGLEAFKSIPLS